MNDLFVSLGIESWKPLLASLLLPPVPLVALVLLGAWRLPRHRGQGWAAVGAGLALIWASCTPALGWALVDVLTRPPPALSPAKIAALVDAPRTAIVVLGAGISQMAPEYGGAEPKPLTLERLRYGLWLARRTRLPVAYTGGLGHGIDTGTPEAVAAGRVAERDFGLPLRWLEDRARDTHENAQYTVALLRAAGIERIVLVTHGFHEQRAMANFARALARAGTTMELLPAPVGERAEHRTTFGDWLPSSDGFALTRLALHEWLGWIGGA